MGKVKNEERKSKRVIFVLWPTACWIQSFARIRREPSSVQSILYSISKQILEEDGKMKKRRILSCLLNTQLMCMWWSRSQIARGGHAFIQCVDFSCLILFFPHFFLQLLVTRLFIYESLIDSIKEMGGKKKPHSSQHSFDVWTWAFCCINIHYINIEISIVNWIIILYYT